jgi:hypothetical protein
MSLKDTTDPLQKPEDRVQCPNCCRLAFVTHRSMGLLFYRCELCETVGALPDPTSDDEKTLKAER